jgi:hypothetical protein
MANANLDLPSFVFQRPITMDPDINFRAAYKLTLKYLRALCAVRPSHPPPDHRYSTLGASTIIG